MVLFVIFPFQLFVCFQFQECSSSAPIQKSEDLAPLLGSGNYEIMFRSKLYRELYGKYMNDPGTLVSAKQNPAEAFDIADHPVLWVGTLQFTGHRVIYLASQEGLKPFYRSRNCDLGYYHEQERSLGFISIAYHPSIKPYLRDLTGKEAAVIHRNWKRLLFKSNHRPYLCTKQIHLTGLSLQRIMGPFRYLLIGLSFCSAVHLCELLVQCVLFLHTNFEYFLCHSDEFVTLMRESTSFLFTVPTHLQLMSADAFSPSAPNLNDSSLISLVHRNEAQITAPDLTVTYERWKLVKFTRFILSEPLVLIYRQLPPYPNSNSGAGVD